MSEFTQALLVAGTLKIALLLVGALFAYMGYRLFIAGVYTHAGDLKAAWGEKYLMIKQAAPGTFFALFGAAIIIVSIVQDDVIEKAPDKTVHKVFESTTQVIKPEKSQTQTSTARTESSNDCKPPECGGGGGSIVERERGGFRIPLPAPPEME